MDERHEDEQFEDEEFTCNWDQALRDFLAEDYKQYPLREEVRYVEGKLKLYANPLGFEFQFCEDGETTRAYLITDIQAAELALTIMAIIQNR